MNAAWGHSGSVSLQSPVQTEPHAICTVPLVIDSLMAMYVNIYNSLAVMLLGPPQ